MIDAPTTTADTADTSEPDTDDATRAQHVTARQHRATLAALHTARQETETQIGRADTKATSLLGLFGAALAGALALAHTVTGAGGVLIAGAIVSLTGAVVALLLVVRARPGGEYGPARWALFHAHPAALVEDLTLPARHDVPRQAARLAELSALAMAKYRAINAAVVLLLAGLVLLSLAVLP
ncbi:MAG TPA: Pycsar system effector family protein [Pseudonocardiaceae bacterium]|nr:Pycsar system effector family protein [Pseudonocardiaceae bacterium]